MKAKTIVLFSGAFSIAVSTVQAGAHTRANDSITTDTTDAGGAPVSSANYSHSGSIGAPIAGTTGLTKAGSGTLTLGNSEQPPLPRSSNLSFLLPCTSTLKANS